jgi:hypothetical protein
MSDSRRRHGPDQRERTWFYLWIAAGEVFGVFGLLQWIVLSPGSAAFEVAKGIEIAAMLFGIMAILRWAKLRGS